MQFDSLKTFCDLVETESFTKAAQINNVTQSAVSQQLTTMEKLVKSLLIERSKKHFRLTREGQIFYECSKQILQTYNALLNEMQEIKDVVSGNIRISSVYSIGLHDLPAYVKRFLKAYPTVNVHVEYRRPNKVYEDVISNLVDLGVASFPQKSPELETVTLHPYPMCLVCHPQHPFAKKKSIRIKELSGHKLIGFDADLLMRKSIDKALREHGVAVRYVMEFDNVETVKRAVETDAGIAIVPSSNVIQEVADQTLTALKIEGADFGGTWAVLYKKNKVLSPAMKQFISILKEKSESLG